jgi:hypothetical protein
MPSNEWLGRRGLLRLWAFVVGLVPTVTSTGVATSTNTLRITETSGTASIYEITVSDEIRPAEDADASPVATGPAVEGVVAGGVHEFEFSGRVTSVRADGESEVYVDGERVEPTRTV